MRVFIAAVIFAALVGAAFWWRVAIPPTDGQPATRAAGNAQGGARMGPLEPATNRQGRDLSDVGVRVTDALACSRLCAIDERCMAMSFVKAADSTAGICWLKGSVPVPSENDAIVSAVKAPAEK